MILRKAMLSSTTIVLATLSLIIFVSADRLLDPLRVAEQQGSTAPPACKLCRDTVKSFLAAMKKTENGAHKSGDTRWEEIQLRPYRESAMRLVDTEVHICKDFNGDEHHCRDFYGEHDDYIEAWFLNKQNTETDLHKHLCIDELKVCCPADHYGLKCLPCSNCNGNGVCKGNGTRKGNGKCACHAGYIGEACDKCSKEYYESYRDDEKLLCSACHSACEPNAGCTAAGPKSCRVCKLGWTMQPDDGGCIDIDECALQTDSCEKNEFCVNNDGSFECLKCDRSCDGCSGDGPDLCNNCAEGYELRDGLCTDIEIVEVEGDAEAIAEIEAETVDDADSKKEAKDEL